jgi:hypothetical protein
MSALAFSLKSDSQPRGFCEDESAYLACEDLYLAKFRHWRGRSGRSYVFSAYPPRECPAYEDAVLLATERGGGVLACLDLGPLPEARLAELRRLYGDRLDEIEFQIHVLANRAAERRALIEDLTPDACA